MDCFFINPDSAVERRRALERSFSANAPGHWRLIRSPVIEPSDINRRGVGGALEPADKSSNLGHLSIIERNSAATKPFMVLEDDACFGPNSCLTVDNSIGHVDKTLEWDILYPDIGFTQVGPMADFLVLRMQLMDVGRTRLINPQGMAFFSTTSYILHPRAVSKILSVVSTRGPQDVPFDLVLRKLVNEGRLMARFIFPFAMTVAATADAPTGDSARTDGILNMYRRMVWRDGSVEPHLPRLAEISKDLGMEAKAFAILWAAMADPSFKPK